MTSIAEGSSATTFPAASTQLPLVLTRVANTPGSGASTGGECFDRLLQLFFHYLYTPYIFLFYLSLPLFL